MAIPSREDFSEKSERTDSTQAMRRIYAKRYADYVEDQVKLLWSGDMDHQQAIFLVRTLGDPTRRDVYLQVLWWAETHPNLTRTGRDKRPRTVRRDLLGDPGSRAFKEALTADVFSDAQEALQRAGFGDLLSSLAYRIGSHQGVRPSDLRAESLTDLFSDEE